MTLCNYVMHTKFPVTFFQFVPLQSAQWMTLCPPQRDIEYTFFYELRTGTYRYILRHTHLYMYIFITYTAVRIFFGLIIVIMNRTSVIRIN